MYGRKIFLPEQPDGWSRVRHDTYIHDSTRCFGPIVPQGKIHNRYTLSRVTKEMYGLPQAG